MVNENADQRLPFGAAFTAGLLQNRGDDLVRRNRGLPAADKLRGSYVASSLDQRDLASLVGGMAVDASRGRDEPVLPVSESFVGALGQLRAGTEFESPASAEGRFHRAAKAEGETLVSPAGAGFSAALGNDCGLDAPANLKKRHDPRRADALDDSVREAEVVRGCAAPVTLHDLARALDRHPEGQAVLEQLRDICGAVPGNVALLQELSHYVNRPPWEQPRQLLGGGAVVGTGNVTGPATSTDNAIARYDGTTGKVIQNSGVTIDDVHAMTGLTGLTVAGAVHTNELTVHGPTTMNGDLIINGPVTGGDAQFDFLRSSDGDAATPGHSFIVDAASGVFRSTAPLAVGISVDGGTKLLLRGDGGDHVITGNTTLQGNLLIDGNVTADNLTLTNPLPVAQGGTGANNAAGARTNLQAAASGPIGSSGLTVSTTDRLLGRVSSGAGAVEEVVCTDFAQSLLDDADAPTARGTLGAIGGGTGGTDNAVLRADGTGGLTAQASDLALSDVVGNTIDLYPRDAGTARSFRLFAGQSSSGGVGGNATLQGGAGGSSAGGNTHIRGGGGTPHGTVEIGDANTSAINVGQSGITTTINGTLALGTDLAITHGGTGASTADGAVQNLTNGATSRTPVLTDEIPFNDVGTGGGKTTPQALHNLLTALTAKTSLVDADQMMLADSADSNVAKKITVANLKSTLGISNLPLFGFNTSDQAVSSGTFANSTGMVVTVAAGVRYAFEACLPAEGTPSGFNHPGFKLRWSGGSATVTNMKLVTKFVNATGTAGEDVKVLKATALNTEANTGSNSSFSGWFMVRGYILVNSDGTIQMQHARTGPGGNAILQNGAWMRLTPLG